MLLHIFHPKNYATDIDIYICMVLGAEGVH
jgi:hypothetical protein